MVDICSICLLEIEDKHVVYKLSCNHKFHFGCFKRYMFKTSHSFFIDCPNCRQLNTNVIYPYGDNHYNNIRSLCSQGVGNIKCHCTTLKGLKCKKKSHLLNYGMCHFHNKDILPKGKCDILCKYIYQLLMCTNKSWETKVSLIDISKKLLLKFDDISSVDDLLKYYFIYIADTKKHNINNAFKNKEILYNYYDLELPPESWLRFCVENRCLF